jgi:hypothetical protein
LAHDFKILQRKLLNLLFFGLERPKLYYVGKHRTDSHLFHSLSLVR